MSGRRFIVEILIDTGSGPLQPHKRCVVPHVPRVGDQARLSSLPRALEPQSAREANGEPVSLWVTGVVWQQFDSTPIGGPTPPAHVKVVVSRSRSPL